MKNDNSNSAINFNSSINNNNGIADLVLLFKKKELYEKEERIMDWKKFWTMTFALSCGIATTSLIGLNMLLTILYDTPIFNGERLVWTMPIYFSVEGYFEIPVFFLGTIILFYILCKLVLKYREEKEEGSFYESGRRNLW